MASLNASSPASSSRRLLVSGIGCALLLILPLVLVRWVPSTDLPQLLAQVELLGRAGDGESGLRVQWWHPNKLGYLPLGLGFGLGTLLGDPASGGRIALALVIAAWVAAVHFTAKARLLDASQAVLASLLVFNVSFHWGFVNFLLGLPLFLVFLHVLGEDLGPERPRGQGPRILVGALLLYAAHVLWLAMALLFLIGEAVRVARWRLLGQRLLWISPVLALTALWYAFFRDTGVDQRLFWGQPPWWRLHPTWLVESLFGGVQGLAEPVIAAALLAWMVLGLVQNRSLPEFGVDRRLLAAAGLLLLAAFLLPAVYHHTIFFAARWLAPGVALLLLATPAPELTPPLRRGVPVLLVLTLVTVLGATWLHFETEELAGFEAALEEIERVAASSETAPRLLGLDFVRTSPTLDGFPYHHLPAYAELFDGVSTQRTFADDPASLVVFEKLPHVYPWTDRLDWEPKKLRQSDFDHFELFLALAPDPMHARFLADLRLEPVDASTTPWRLYRIEPRPKESRPKEPRR